MGNGVQEPDMGIFIANGPDYKRDSDPVDLSLTKKLLCIDKLYLFD